MPTSASRCNTKPWRVASLSILADALESVVRRRRARKGMGTIVDGIMTRKPIKIAVDATVSRGDLMKLFAMK